MHSFIKVLIYSFIIFHFLTDRFRYDGSAWQGSVLNVIKEIKNHIAGIFIINYYANNFYLFLFMYLLQDTDVIVHILNLVRIYNQARSQHTSTAGT